MKSKSIIYLLSLTILSQFVVSCATVFRWPKKPKNHIVQIAGYPIGAEVYVNDEYVGNTPLDYKVEKYKNFDVKIKKSGFAEGEYEIKRKLSPIWFPISVVSGVSLGLVPTGIDWMTRSFYKIKTKDIKYELAKTNEIDLNHDEISGEIANNNSSDSYFSEKEMDFDNNPEITKLDVSEYQRSSLTMLVVNDINDDYDHKDKLMKSWERIQFPDKYNEHSIPIKEVDYSKIKISEKEWDDRGYCQDTIKKLLKFMKNFKTYKLIKNTFPYETIQMPGEPKPEGIIGRDYWAVILPGHNRTTTDASGNLKVVGWDPPEEEYRELKFIKYCQDKHLANHVIAKWYGLKNGKFDMSLIKERGVFNASESDILTADMSVRGRASIGDVGEKLIKSTYTTLTSFYLRPNEPIARKIRDKAISAIKQNATDPNSLTTLAAIKACEIAYNKTKDGYTLFSSTALYQLNWNEKIQNKFYSYWNGPDAFMKSNAFSFRFVDVQSNKATLLFAKDRSLEEVIEEVLFRNVSKLFSKLQQRNPEFMPAMTILTAEPITAKIGTKEGVEPGDKFEVLEAYKNIKTNSIIYKKIGTVKADKKVIWDNNYNLTESVDKQFDKKGNLVNSTKFKGCKVEPGMLLKQIK